MQPRHNFSGSKIRIWDALDETIGQWVPRGLGTSAALAREEPGSVRTYTRYVCTYETSPQHHNWTGALLAVTASDQLRLINPTMACIVFASVVRLSRPKA